MLSETLKKLESAIADFSPRTINYFNDGLDRETILKKFNANNIPEIDELITLYEWHNGQTFGETIEDLPMIGLLGSYMYPIDDAIYTYIDFKNSAYALIDKFFIDKMCLFSDSAGGGYFVEIPKYPKKNIAVFELFLVEEFGFLNKPRYDSVDEFITHFISMLYDGSIECIDGIYSRNIDVCPYLSQKK